MNTIIYQTIRAGVVLGVALFVFVGDVFAAPSLSPVTVTQVSSDSATLVGYVSNSDKTSTVWFELNDGMSASPVVIGMNGVYHAGFFQGYAIRLTPGATYQYRAAAMEGGVTVYSPISSFKTTGENTTSVSSGASFGGGSSVSTQGQSVSTQTNTSNKNTTKTVVAKNTTNTNSAVSGAGDTVGAGKTVSVGNGNTASVIGSGGGVFPNTLVGWVALIIAMLLAVLFIQMIYESTENRKRVIVVKTNREDEKKEQPPH